MPTGEAVVEEDAAWWRNRTGGTPVVVAQVVGGIDTVPGPAGLGVDGWVADR